MRPVKIVVLNTVEQGMASRNRGRGGVHLPVGVTPFIIFMHTSGGLAEFRAFGYGGCCFSCLWWRESFWKRIILVFFLEFWSNGERRAHS
jgi:hypothetical protein